MVLSSPQVTTPSDTSSSREVLDLQARFASVSGVNQDSNDAADANLFLEDPFVSAATDSGLVHPTMTTTSNERSPVDRLLLDPPTGKSLNVVGFVADSELSRSDNCCRLGSSCGGDTREVSPC